MKVLLVDNDPLFLELSKTFLEVFYDIISDTVESAGKALEKLEEDSYDVVIADYEMPSMDGITLLRTIRDRSINVPFILFTGIEEKEIINCAIESGAHSFIQKRGDPKTQYSELSKQIWQIVGGCAVFS
jgi:two-component system OmpR family response regulator